MPVATKREITPADILPMDEFGRIRRDKRAEMVELKRHRRLPVGPYATFYFENFATMWMQVHEMLFIEKGGAEQVADELSAYNPLIPQGRNLVATVMFEIDDEVKRKRFLSSVGGIDAHAFIQVGGEKVMARPESDVERTRERDNKASSVHFLHFDFTPDQIKRFAAPTVEIMIGFSHPNYGHLAVVPPLMRAALASDFAI